jgi:poly(3-hydroxybutyrate) depolymerase
MSALRQLLAQTLAAVAAKEPTLEAALRADAGRGIACTTLLETPFVRVQRFARGQTRRRILLLAPHSGFAASVLSPLAAALLTLGEVWVTDWRDARLVPASAGSFDLAQQTALATGLLAADDRPAHLVAFSQSGPALLMAAASNPARAASMALLGTPIDAARSPVQFQNLLAQWPRPAVIAQLTGPVPQAYPGAGRLVYPGLVQLLCLSLASPETYLGIQHGLYLDFLEGRDRGFRRMHADLHCVIDIPAELFTDMLDWVVYRPALAGNAIRLGSGTIPLAPLATTPLLTVEAAEDELVGPGQTHAAADAIGDGVRHTALDLPGARHADLFTGPLFLRRLAPTLARFIAEAQP